jgi:hypothetical protein
MTPQEPDSVESTPRPSAVSPTLLARLERHFLSCSAIAGTGLGMLVLTEPARADFMFTSFPTFRPGAVTFGGNYQIPSTGTYINLQNGHAYMKKISSSNYRLTVRLYNPAGPPHPINNIYTISGRYSSGPNSGKIYGRYIQVTGQPPAGHPYFYQKGQSVPGANPGAHTYSGGFSGINAALTAPGVKYVFIGFNITAPTAPNYSGTLVGSKTQYGVYGFMELRYNPTNGYTYIVGWEYSLSAGAITTEIIPEPGTLGLTALAMGVAGIVAMRRKRAAAKKAADEAAVLPPPTPA